MNMHFPTDKHGHYTKSMQIKLFTTQLRNCIKYTKMTTSKNKSKRVKHLTSEWNQK